jgi:hypothetical protein
MPHCLLPHCACCAQHPLSHPEWPLDLAIIAAGFRVCMEKGCLVDFRPLLSGMSLLQFYPGLHLHKVDAGGCNAYWMRLRAGERHSLSCGDVRKSVLWAFVFIGCIRSGAWWDGDKDCCLAGALRASCCCFCTVHCTVGAVGHGQQQSVQSCLWY